MFASTTPGGREAAWAPLRRRLRSALPLLYPVEPLPATSFSVPPFPVSSFPVSSFSLRPGVPPSSFPASCLVCRGPARPGFARCYQCDRHELLGHGLLADAVVPISYAVKGAALAADLWRYKSWTAPSKAARASLLALLLTFLHDHGACVWRHAGMPAPDRLAVVPTGCGRPGPHPLLELASPYLRLPLTRLAIRPGTQGRELNLNRFLADEAATGARVLLVEDSWVSGASAQSAAAALRRAGARQVAIVMLGRHVDPADPLVGPWAARLRPGPYEVSECAVHPQI